MSEYNADGFFYSRARSMASDRSDRLVIVEITMIRSRSDAIKQPLYAEIAANLEKRAGISSNDVYIFVHENDYSDWSVGHGQFAMVFTRQRGDDR